MESVRPRLPSRQPFVPTDGALDGPAHLRDKNYVNYRLERYSETHQPAGGSHTETSVVLEEIESRRRCPKLINPAIKQYALTKKRNSVRRGADLMRAGELLIELGVPREMVSRDAAQNATCGSWGRYYDQSRNRCWSKKNSCSSFWHRPTSELHDLLEAARASYRDKIKRAHPDKNGIAHDEAVRLNGLWRRIKALFQRHGIEVSPVTPARLPNETLL